MPKYLMIILVHKILKSHTNIYTDIHMHMNTDTTQEYTKKNKVKGDWNHLHIVAEC